MAIPKYDELMKPMLEVLGDGNPYKMKALERILAEKENLTEEEKQELLPSKSQTVFSNRVGWARTYLKKAGLIESPAKATVQITDAGRKVLSENPDMIDVKYLDQFPAFHNFMTDAATANKTTAATDNTDLSPDEQIDNAYTKINASLADDLLNEVMKTDPYKFEKLVVDLLSKMGYGTIEYGSYATKASGDDGIDGIIMEDRLGFSLIYMQAKRWARDHSVGQPEIQSFVGQLPVSKVTACLLRPQSIPRRQKIMQSSSISF